MLMNKHFSKSLLIFSMILCLTIGTPVFAAEPNYQIDYTYDYIDPTKSDSVSGFSDGTTSQYQWSYNGWFNHILYTSSSLTLTSGDTVTVYAQQKSNNSNYPDVYVQYVWVNKGTNLTNPDDDTNLSNIHNVSGGSYTTWHSTTLTFNIGTNANNTTGHLRFWNLNNINGNLNPSTKMIEVKGDVWK